MSTRLIEFVEHLPRKRIVLIGDLMVDRTLYGNAELRVFLTKISLLLPSDLGIFGLADAGRVFSAGEQSTVLHRGFGGGVWLAPLGRSNTVSLAVARSREESAVYLRTGFQF